MHEKENKTNLTWHTENNPESEELLKLNWVNFYKIRQWEKNNYSINILFHNLQLSKQ